MNAQVELVCDSHSSLGEGPLWDRRYGRLYWVDIYGHKIHSFDPRQPGRYETIEAGPFVSSIVPRASGGFAVTLEDGFYGYDPEARTLVPIASVEADLSGNRFNDGKCDPSGRYIAGTMSRTDEPARGSLYSLGSDGTVNKLLGAVGCSNGLAWSADGKTMYYVDSSRPEISAFDYDASSGQISGRRAAAAIPAEDSTPDGMTIDAEGMLWLAHWRGWKVTRWDPSTGTKLGEIPVPVERVTSVAFGGERLDELYITTASIDVAPEQAADQPHAGGLFRVKAGVRGTAPFSFSG
ncbi:SMP-30/gluconolactonase/LRE family protein [Cohnella lubricantis]|uniref:Regucalcin n=2 Tax=Cohnella lubricantis TaxID=2163172 RepID=A0A841TCB1_9BACL|nr:SMP-30/gluconolactonase/LRE family protein [Cohnella lubricantis]